MVHAVEVRFNPFGAGRGERGQLGGGVGHENRALPGRVSSPGATPETPSPTTVRPWPPIATAGGGRRHDIGHNTRREQRHAARKEHVATAAEGSGSLRGTPRRGPVQGKAARISNAAANRGRSAVGKSGGTSPPYEDWTVAELHKRAKELDLHGYSKLNKKELIDKIRNH